MKLFHPDRVVRKTEPTASFKLFLIKESGFNGTPYFIFVGVLVPAPRSMTRHRNGAR